MRTIVAGIAFVAAIYMVLAAAFWVSVNAADALWYLAFNINGMTVISFQPFQSEEACRLAARQVNVAVFECLEAPKPDASK